MQNPWILISTSLQPTPPAPPDTARVYGLVAPVGSEPAAVTAFATIYTSLTGLTDDGWVAGDAVFDAAEDLFGNSAVATDTAVTRIIVVKRASPVDEVWTYLVNSADDGIHTAEIGGVVAGTFTASTDTVDVIRTGLTDAINLGAFAASHTATDTIAATLSVTGDAPPGVPFTLTGSAPSGTAPTITRTVDAVGLFADLTAAYTLQQWWGLLLPSEENSLALDEARRWVDADTTTRRGFLFAQQVDVGLADSVDTDNLALTWQLAKRARSKVWTHPTPTEYMVAAMIGKVGGAFPGSRAWHYLPLSGSVESTLTPARTAGQLQTLFDRRVGYTARFYGPTSELTIHHGQLPDDHFVAQVHAADWWWFATTVAMDAEMKSNAGADLDEAGLRGLATAVEVATTPMINARVLAASSVSVTFTPIVDIPPGELAIGDYQTTGRITVSGVLTPKLRSLAVRAEFAVVPA